MYHSKGSKPNKNVSPKSPWFSINDSNISVFWEVSQPGTSLGYLGVSEQSTDVTAQTNWK